MRMTFRAKRISEARRNEEQRAREAVLVAKEDQPRGAEGEYQPHALEARADRVDADCEVRRIEDPRRRISQQRRQERPSTSRTRSNVICAVGTQRS